MINLIPYIQLADSIFTRFIFIPMVYILYRKFIAEGTSDRQKQGLYRCCKALVILYLIRIFCAGFIFTPVNYDRFTDSIWFPVIQAIFY